MNTLSLSDSLAELGPMGKRLSSRLKSLGIMSIEDLLFHYPFRYEDWSRVLPIKNLIPGMQATVSATVKTISFRPGRWKIKPLIEALLEDQNGDHIRAVWFNASYLIKTLTPGTALLLSGKIDRSKDALQLTHPVWEKNTTHAPMHTARIIPIYHATNTISQKQIRSLMAVSLQNIPSIPDPLPSWIASGAKIIPLDRAIRAIHFPSTWAALSAAQTRLKFDELFLLQLRSALARQELTALKSTPIPFHETLTRTFVARLPFKLTTAQRKAAWEIIKDLGKGKPMNRLLEGDVGSGKTVAAAIAALNVIASGHQVAYLAPTAILAAQQFATFCRLFSDTPLCPPLTKGGNGGVFTIALITQGDIRVNKIQSFPPQRDPAYLRESDSRGGTKPKVQNERGYKKISKQELAVLLRKGRVDISIGTHALLSEHIQFQKLALVIVDEQHRFGVNQRAALLRRSAQIKTQIDADADDFLYKELTYQIRGAAFEVANSLGLGLKENVYQKALEESLKQKRLLYEREKSINVSFHDTRVGSFKPDFIIDQKVIVELKALPFIGKIEEKQLWSYLKGSNYKVALLINFGNDKLDIRRIIYDTARDKTPQPSPNQHASVINQHMSASSDLRPSASHLRESAYVPHLLSMTATPIPRSLALVAYADLDLSIINELPKGRAPITTKIIPPEQRQDAYNLIKQELSSGHQAFIICPLIDPSDALGVKSVKEEAERLKREHFPHVNLAALHGRMTPASKDKIMGAFAQGSIQVLVSTPVVEVGIDVPNATVILIESAERFGLAQLHQLRGRVGRSTHSSWCLLATETEQEEALKRLHAAVSSRDGFALAEIDLEMRGPGEVYGTQQSGFLDTLKIAKLTDVIILKQSKETVARLLQEDPALSRYPLLQRRLAVFEESVHFE
ncbi:MAG: GxxExxY protein [Patescibacteria group bacterium]